IIYIFSNNMIIYNPDGMVYNDRLLLAEKILGTISYKHCFITGSFLFKEKYNDIDLFIISRGKKKPKIKNEMLKIAFIDYNDTYSLFFHSITKSCVSKSILPKKELKVTLSDFWQVINEAVPTLMNEKDKFHKNVRFLFLYTEYFKDGKILGSNELNERISFFKDYKDILEYITISIPDIINSHAKKSYIKRHFYTQAGYYKSSMEYESQKYLYRLSHSIIRGVLQ
ncbi:MAG: hypothetical protein V1859_10065, partial [archaeon]